MFWTEWIGGREERRCGAGRPAVGVLGFGMIPARCNGKETSLLFIIPTESTINTITPFNNSNDIARGPH